MPNQKLLETLSCFSVDEQRQLRSFVESSYHNRKYNRPKIIGLLDRILSTKKIQTLDKKMLNREFFPKKNFAEKGKNPIDSLASDLYSLVRKFIHLEGEKQNWNKGTEALAMARFFRKNDLDTRFWQMIKQARSFFENQTMRDEKIFLKLWQLEEEVVTFQSTFNTYTDDSNLVNANVALDNFYTIAKFEKTTALLFQKLMGQVPTEDALLLSNLLLKVFPEYNDVQTPIAELHYLTIKLLEAPKDLTLLNEFTQKSKAYRKHIPVNKYRNIMAFYRYFVGRKYQTEASGTALLTKLFNLYKQHLEEGFFHLGQEKCLLPGSLKLMINIAIKVGAIDWAKSLLEDYPPEAIIGTRFPMEAHSLCEAEIFFAEGCYEEAQDAIKYRNFENINYSILADILLIKTYYVTENNLLESRISALGQKVRRSRLTKAVKLQYLNFLRVINQLIKNRVTKPPEELLKIQTLTNELVPLIEREWLKKMLQEI